MKILKFFTPTCMPCRVLGKILDKLEDVEVIPIDATENLEKVDRYNVFSTPTLVFLKEDKEVDRITGMTTEAKIKEIINKNM